MKFNYDLYEKTFPKTEPAPEVDSAVDGYTPTAEEAKGVKPDLAAVKIASDPAEPAQPEKTQPEPIAEDISQPTNEKE